MIDELAPAWTSNTGELRLDTAIIHPLPMQHSGGCSSRLCELIQNLTIDNLHISAIDIFVTVGPRADNIMDELLCIYRCGTSSGETTISMGGHGHLANITCKCAADSDQLQQFRRAGDGGLRHRNPQARPMFAAKVCTDDPRERGLSSY